MFLRGPVSAHTVLAELASTRPFDVLDGPVGPHTAVGLRETVFVELVDRCGHGAWFGPVLSRYRMFVRLVDVSAARPAGAWVAAHALLWKAAQCRDVSDALLLGSGTRALRYRNGHIRPVPQPQQV
ncbi:hypothetical protein GIY23_00545 [Allosaccharopolyspora coralli]|uniref:Uncharacterized protein n=1 Tax=Allosaccharopolyspora coralli TaxID=2665642 RepID=A0A5Q3QM95_9PSEU|nr:hypothetical protein GIY23_00545 [Allosaccharopolyspora coralli]